ncbi:hypothetical protein HDU93_009148 [Gonapodya sp. JEL0774]|nr:hypothetical protein HDU93_009148 [Gonapodya sp. JEL0774]
MLFFEALASIALLAAVSFASPIPHSNNQHPIVLDVAPLGALSQKISFESAVNELVSSVESNLDLIVSASASELTSELVNLLESCSEPANTIVAFPDVDVSVENITIVDVNVTAPNGIFGTITVVSYDFILQSFLNEAASPEPTPVDPILEPEPSSEPEPTPEPSPVPTPPSEPAPLPSPKPKKPKPSPAPEPAPPAEPSPEPEPSPMPEPTPERPPVPTPPSEPAPLPSPKPKKPKPSPTPAPPTEPKPTPEPIFVFPNVTISGNITAPPGFNTSLIPPPNVTLRADGTLSIEFNPPPALVAPGCISFNLTVRVPRSLNGTGVGVNVTSTNMGVAVFSDEQKIAQDAQSFDFSSLNVASVLAPITITDVVVNTTVLVKSVFGGVFVDGLVAGVNLSTFSVRGSVAVSNSAVNGPVSLESVFGTVSGSIVGFGEEFNASSVFGGVTVKNVYNSNPTNSQGVNITVKSVFQAASVEILNPFSGVFNLSAGFKGLPTVTDAESKIIITPSLKPFELSGMRGELVNGTLVVGSDHAVVSSKLGKAVSLAFVGDL